MIIMAQFHHVVYFDTADESWHVDPQTDAYFSDGEVWDYAGVHEWQRVPDNEFQNYMHQVEYILDQLNSP